MQADCNRLPDACPSLDCAEVYTSFFEDCPDMMLGDSKYQTFYTNCQELQAQSAAMSLRPLTVLMFRVQIAMVEQQPTAVGT